MSEYSKAFDRVVFERSPFRTAILLLLAAQIGLGAASLFADVDTGGSAFALVVAFFLIVGAAMTSRGASGGQKLLFGAIGLAVVFAVFETGRSTETRRETEAAYTAEQRQTEQLRSDLEALCRQAGGRDLNDPVCMNFEATFSNHFEAGREFGGLPPRPIE